MAVVYLARHNQLGSLHAVKVLTLPTPAVQARLLQEGRAQSALRHSNVVAVTDVVDLGGSPGLVMEYVEGPSLRRLLQERLLEIHQIDHVARGILRGVAAAHRHGLVHRDLKPSNILVAVQDGSLVPKITDFGLTKVLGQGPVDGSIETRAGLPMGTPSYMAPEQIVDASRVDERADVFALGAILYEMVVGKRAFYGSDVVETYQRVKTGTYRDAQELKGDIPDRMLDAIRGALVVDRDKRIPDVATLLETWRGGVAVTDRPTDPWGSVLLDDILALGQQETRADLPLGPTFTPDGSSETWADQDPIEQTPATLLVPTPPPPEPRSPWRAGAVLALVAVALAFGWFWFRPAPQVVLSTEVIPIVHIDPVVQEEFEAGWRALLDADFERAVRRLSVVVERQPDHSLPWLVHWRALRYADRSGESLTSFWAGVERAEGQGDEDELARALGKARRHGWEREGQGVLDYLDTHPGDFFGRIAALGMVPINEGELSEALLGEARAIDGRPALLAFIQASRELQLEQFDRAEDALRAGLELNPDSPTLLALQGEILLQRGQFAKARDVLIDALDKDPGMYLARTRLGGAYLMLGDDESATATTQQMMRPPTRWDHRLRYATYVSEVLVGQGRLQEAITIIREAEEVAAEQNAWISVITLGGTEAIYQLAVDNPEGMMVATDRLVEVSHNPEIPDAERENLVRNLLYAKGLSAVRLGDVQAGVDTLARLQKLDRVWPAYLEYLEREIAVAQRDPARVAELFETIPESCAGDLERAHYLWLAEGIDEAREWVVPRLDDPAPCSSVGETRLRFADGHVILAELALRDDKRGEANKHLDAFDELWPDADHDVPLVMRATELRESLGH